MKRENRPLILRLISFTLAIIFSLPVNIFATNASINEMKINANESIDDSENKLKESETIIQDNDKERKPGDQDKDNYSLSEIVSIDGNKEKLIYTIKLSKNISNIEDVNNRLNIALAINKNQDIKDISVKDVYQLIDGEKKEINYEIKKEELDNNDEEKTTDDSLKSFSIITDGFNESLEFVIEASIDKDSKHVRDLYNLNLSISIEDSNISNTSLAYTLVENKDGKTELKKKELSDYDFLKAEYIINEDKNSKFDSIIWTDFISGKEVEEEKDISYKFDLDKNQISKDSKIKIDYYKQSETGFVLDEELSEEIDFTKEIKLNVPSLYIAKISLETKVSKENTSIEKYFLNDKEISNPIFTNEIQIKEETKETVKETKQEIKETVKETSKDTEKEISTETIKESVKEIEIEVAGNKEIVSDDKDKNDSKEKAVKEFDELLEKNSKEGENSEEVDKGFIANIFAGLVDFFGKSNLDKANKELKIALADESKTLEDIQTLLHELGEKYELNREDQAKLMDDNGDAIKALILKYADENFRPSMLFVLTDDDKAELEKKKFNIITEFRTSIIAGPIKKGQYFNIHLDDKLTVKDSNSLKSIYNGNVEIARPEYDESTNTIKYEILNDITQNLQIPLSIPVDYNTEKISNKDFDENGLMTVVNKVSGLGVVDPKELTPQKVNSIGNLSGAPIKPEDGDTKLEFITELEYFTETLTRATNEQKLFDIVKSNNPELSKQQIRSDYVGWKINIPGVDKSGMDIREIKKDKYKYDNLNFSLYAPAGQSLEDYQVVVEDGEGGSTTYSGKMTEKEGDHYLYNFSIPRNQLTEKGYNIYVVAKAPKKRQNYAVGLKIEPDNNYVLSFKKEFEKQFEEFAKGNPFILKWKDTSDANPYANGIELLDTRMVYLEPQGWQDLFPYNGFRSVDYNDNIDDTDIMKNTVSMFGNIDENGNITWTISETFPAEKLENKNTVGRDAYSAKTDGQGLTGPSIQILVPNKNGGYDVKKLDDNVDIAKLQSEIGNKPGTIVNYTYTDQAKNKDEFTTISLDSGKKASIAHKPVLERKPEDIVDKTGLEYLHKVQEHNDGPGYEIALSSDQANTMKAFIPKDTSKNPRYNDPNFIPSGVIVFCLNPGKPEPTRQHKFNGTITKGEWSTNKDSWEENGRAIAALATASEAKSSPLYKGQANDEFYARLYEHVLKLFWYGQELAEEYQLDEQSYYKIIQYNLYYWIAGENYAESFRTMNGYVRNYFSSAEYSYAQELKNRIAAGKDWKSVDYDKDIQIFYYGHDKTRSYQNTITGDTKRNNKKGSITVNKLDQDGKKLAGAVFQLLDVDENPIKTLVTDTNGVAIFEDLEYGTYYIKEVQAPKGYIVTGQLSKVEVNGEKAHIAFNVTNIKNEIEFRKVNEEGLAMEGVVFELRRNGRVLSGQDQTSDKDGSFSWKELTPGYYEVVEKKVNNALYSENEGRVVASFRVDQNNKIQNKVIYFPNGSSTTDIVNKKNEGKPIGIEFTKVDLETKKSTRRSRICPRI